MKVITKILTWLKETIEDQKFWKKEKKENLDFKVFNRFKFMNSKEWEDFKYFTGEIYSLNLELISKENLDVFYVNFYNLLFLDIFLSHQLNVDQLDFDEFPLNDFYQIGESKWNLFDISNKISKEDHFLCLCDGTNSSPKLKLKLTFYA